MTFQIGNQLGGKRPKLCYDALMLQLKSAGDDMPALRKCAQKLIDLAVEGEQWAVQELFNRIDGRVPQAITDEAGGNIMLQVVRYIVDGDEPQVIDVTPQSSIEAQEAKPDIEQSLDNPPISD